ncbi:vesicle-trafficking protein SEC22b-like [Paramacrobiotus metropolitanus]|uniref:vesicle-trafficking protein SEC22b-like n=1 Tax=Paramacrobiotus metropolitanus TaxID=2943436 RepID=UPI002445F86A|nr:vesicle-trafficking protein SEC22b-like [Paramacrobiotus metropolitanus]
MVLLTMIARMADGLPLAASVQDDEEHGKNLIQYQTQAKQIFKRLTPSSPNRCTIDSGNYYFHYIIVNDVCYLVLTEKSFPKRVAFSYLEDLQNEFDMLYGNRVNTVSRPYAFIEFDNYIQKAKKTFNDSRARRQLGQLNNELQDVQRIMVQNIDDVLQRGQALSDLQDKAGMLSAASEKYRKDAKTLNKKASTIKIAAVIILVVILFLYVKFSWF